MSQPPPNSLNMVPDDNPGHRVPWGPGDAVLGVLMALGLLLVGSLIVFPITGDSGVDFQLGAVLVTEVALVGTALWFARRNGAQRPFEMLGLRGPQKGWLRIAAAGFGLYLVAAFVLTLVVGDPEQEDLADSLGFDQSVFAAILAGLLIVVVAPICEELYFRGFFFAGLRSRLPFGASALISAVLFGVVHATSSNLVAVAQLAVLGIILAAAYERAGTLWSNIAIHMFNNAIAFTLLVTT